ncbi:hypothetical protein NDN08_005919 [Rhodosorus marinus]|uniref:Peptidase A2 domain-containing protein n=1 Tax=Rhodosorus marinus TaxID=101924 RepID=A0AAV8V4V1_9RHOD|nr:hypothetical protein NDN08_005919 [Rhodosorus marinus]
MRFPKSNSSKRSTVATVRASSSEHVEDAAIAQVISEYETYSQGLQDSAIRQLRLHARIAGQQVEALVDAGAMVNLLDPTVQQEAGLNEETKRKRLSSVFGDDREVSVVNAVKIECHPKWASTTCFHITPLGGARAILGLPWLTANQAVVHAAPRMESVYTPDVGDLVLRCNNGVKNVEDYAQVALVGRK